jgi:hypothetical protein
MDGVSRMQEQRFELKYLIEEARAAQIRPFVQQYLSVDPFGERQPDLSYPVHSLYLDSDSLETYWHTVNGNPNRFKLRLRYYDDHPDTPCFFEIKRRLNHIILKERGGVRKSAVPSLLAGDHAQPEHLLRPGSLEDLMAVRHFQELMLHLRARPLMHVAYRREAYEADGDNSARITFDRQVHCGPNGEPDLRIVSPECVPPFGRTVILELKFTDRFPDWFRVLVERFNCVLEGAAKYVGGIDLGGRKWASGLPMPGWLDHLESTGALPAQ